MKLLATLNVEFEAGDYVEAAEFQQQMRELLADVRARFEGADLELKERRRRPARDDAPPRSAARNPRNLYATGMRSLYEDV